MVETGPGPDDENVAGWASPTGGRAAPPPAPFPTSDSTPRVSRRRKKAGVGSFVAFGVVLAARLLAPTTGDDSPRTFSGPPRDVGVPVAGVTLTSEQVCELVRPRQLRELYGVAFDRGVPGPDVGSAGGEPSDDPEVVAGSCQWSATDGAAGGLRLQILSIGPLIGGDANATYEALRPRTPSVGFDSNSDIGDEAFFLLAPFGSTGAIIDTMTMRSGGVILTMTSTAGIEPVGGLDSIAEIGQIAVDNLPPS